MNPSAYARNLIVAAIREAKEFAGIELPAKVRRAHAYAWQPIFAPASRYAAQLSMLHLRNYRKYGQ